MKVSLNKNFYRLEAIKEALEDFREVCKGSIIKYTPSSIEVGLEPSEAINENLGKEFCNYVLGLMKNKSFV